MNATTNPDLPQDGMEVRWTQRRKAAVLCELEAGRLTRREAWSRWGISEDEIREWFTRWRMIGHRGLCLRGERLYRQLAG